MKIFIEPKEQEWMQIMQRPIFDSASLNKSVSDILLDVKLHGDEAIKKYTSQFDGIELDDLKVSEKEITEATALVSDELKAYSFSKRKYYHLS